MKKIILITVLMLSSISSFAFGEVLGVERTNSENIYNIKFTSCAVYPSIDHELEVINKKDVLVTLRSTRGHCIGALKTIVGQFVLSDLFKRVGIEELEDSRILFSFN